MNPNEDKATQLLELALALCEEDANEGICIECGETHSGVEPDARKYKCEACGQRKVYGAQEVVVMYGA